MMIQKVRVTVAQLTEMKKIEREMQKPGLTSSKA